MTEAQRNYSARAMRDFDVHRLRRIVRTLRPDPLLMPVSFRQGIYQAFGGVRVVVPLENPDVAQVRDAQELLFRRSRFAPPPRPILHKTI